MVLGKRGLRSGRRLTRSSGVSLRVSPLSVRRPYKRSRRRGKKDVLSSEQPEEDTRGRKSLKSPLGRKKKTDESESSSGSSATSGSSSSEEKSPPVTKGRGKRTSSLRQRTQTSPSPPRSTRKASKPPSKVKADVSSPEEDKSQEIAPRRRRGRPPSKKRVTPPPIKIEPSSDSSDTTSSSDEEEEDSTDHTPKTSRGKSKSSAKGGASIKKRPPPSKASSSTPKNNASNKIVKKTSKAKRLAQIKLKQMKSSLEDVWTNPPRRAASLNAAAVLTCLYDNEPVRKPETPGSKKTPEEASPPTPENKPLKRGRKKKKKIVESSPSSSDSDPPTQPSTPSKKTKKKSLKDEFKMDIKDMIVKKRIASLNASAIMTASYGNYNANKPLKEDKKESTPKVMAAANKKTLAISEKNTKKQKEEDSTSPKKQPKETPTKKSETPKNKPEPSPKNKPEPSPKNKPEPLSMKEAPSPPKKAKKIASFKKESNSSVLLPPQKKSSSSSDTIIVEIQDEDIKNQLIASAMKKAGKHHHHSLPPKRRALTCSGNASSGSSGSSSCSAPKYKKKRPSVEKILYEEDEDEEIETITTEGAARSAAEEEAISQAPPPLATALNTEMNKIVIDGRVVHQGMYQVVHRFETISTTTALMNRDQQQNNCESQDGSRKFAPMGGSIASLSTAAAAAPSNNPAERISSGPFIGSASTAHSLAGYYQPPGPPLLRASSPHGQSTTVVSSAPPTATVQPTVQTCIGSKRPPSPEKSNGDGTAAASRSSPLKPTPTAHPYYPYGHFSPYPQYYDPYASQVPPPPPYPAPYGAHPYATAAHNHHPHTPPYRPAYPAYYPFSPGGYYLTPNPPHPFPPGTLSPHPHILQEQQQPTTNTTQQQPQIHSRPPAPNRATHQVTLQGASSFNYATLGQHPYPGPPAGGGRILAPIFALAAPPLDPHHHPVPSPNPLYPYAFPNLSAAQSTPQPPPPSATLSSSNSSSSTSSSLSSSSSSSSVVHPEASKNELAGSQKVGKGPDSQRFSSPPTTNKKKEKKQQAGPIKKQEPTLLLPPKPPSNHIHHHTSCPPKEVLKALTPSPSKSINYSSSYSTSSSSKQKEEEAHAKSESSPKKSSLPKGLVITEVLESSGPPVLHIPEPPRQPKEEKQRGHPGLPNGLLRMANTSFHIRRPPASHLSTRVTPKDLKSKIALSRIGLMGKEESSPPSRLTLKPPEDNPPPPLHHIHRQQQQSSESAPLKKLKKKKDYLESKCSPISVSMAQCAVSAVLKSQGAPPKLITKSNSKYYSPNTLKAKTACSTTGGSPSSSRSSSRNSSLSPRERSFPKVSPKSKNCNAPSSSSSVLNGYSLKKKAGNSPSSSSLLPLLSSSAASGSLTPKKHKGGSAPGAPKLSNGWSWVGEGTEQKVYLNNEDPPSLRNCYSSMKHTEGDVIKVRDCILLASGNRKKDLPFIAKVTSLWEHPANGEMMLSLLWYYRPEHLDHGRNNFELSDEIYASKHRDFTSVACVEDKCYVMTYNEYCRYRKFLRMIEQNVSPPPTSAVPELESGYTRQHFLPKCRVAPDRIFLCRRVYESRQRRLLKNPV